MLDFDLCKQCAKDDGKGYWLSWTTEIMEENRLEEFVLGTESKNIHFSLKIKTSSLERLLKYSHGRTHSQNLLYSDLLSRFRRKLSSDFELNSLF